MVPQAPQVIFILLSKERSAIVKCQKSVLEIVIIWIEVHSEAKPQKNCLKVCFKRV